jgi:plastocyanin
MLCALSLALASAGLVGCRGNSSPKDSGATVVRLEDPELVFSPGHLSIRTGEKVTWRWPGGTAHNVTFQNFASGTMTQGSFDHVFDQVGTYRYECTLHTADGKGMVGEVVVTP